MSKIRTKAAEAVEQPADVRDPHLQDASDWPEIRQLGICTTCDHSKTCLFLKASRKPVWFCEEFIDTKSRAASEPRAVMTLATNEANYKEALEMGLCANCDTRSSCMHRKAGEPVWDCEDYM